MVVASLIKKFCNNTGEVKIWGDGSPIRDFIYSKDVARMMIDVVEKEITVPINLGSEMCFYFKLVCNFKFKTYC